MCGCDKAEMALASRSKRAFRSGLAERCCGRTLMATSRPSRVSRARYTSPMPPAPSGDAISYGPNFVPAPIKLLIHSLANCHHERSEGSVFPWGLQCVAHKLAADYLTTLVLAFL